MKRDKVIYLIELFKRQLTLVYGVHTATTKIMALIQPLVLVAEALRGCFSNLAASAEPI
jgi:hypothetical protein